MDLNSYDHFSKVPDVAIERSRFSKPYDHKTTFDAGQLVPFYIEDCLPASTYQISTAMAVRMATPIFPVMDNCYLDFYYFFVPYRILWDHWLEFMGENRSSYWTQQTDYYVPQLTASSGGFKAGSVADHFGFPTGVSGIKVSQFPFRAYCMIWNEWFRNENTDNPTYNITSDADLNSGAGFTALYGDALLSVCREHDYFSDALPQPQKMEPVTIPLAGSAIVKTSLNPSAHEDLTANPLQFRIIGSSSASASGKYPMYSSVAPSTGSGIAYVRVDGSPVVDGQTLGVVPSNLYADMSSVTAATINDLRMAFATQRYAERLAYGGSRYTEQLNTFYGLTTQDSRLQRPEFLGSDRVTINMSQVLQTSSTDTTSPQGNTAAYSLTVGSGKAPITYSTQEHGIIMGLCCVRHTRTYQQGINREWSRRELFDFYQPTFAHLGNQAILNKEIYAQGSAASDDGVFGYQEAWGEYRYKPSHVTGEFRSNYSNSLDPWHYADYYNRLPILSTGWMAEGKDEIDRTLAVKTQNQFIADFHVSTVLTAPMPLYSVPGLLDHF